MRRTNIEQQANYYKNYPLMDKNIVAVVHIEDTDDKRFWDMELQSVLPGKYHFVSQSKSESGNPTTGCQQCLKYLKFLNRNFFICIDSDLRLLRGESDLNAGNYVAQTYAYSWESHACEAAHLEARFLNKVRTSDFSFVTFLSEFSKIVYLPLLYLTYHATPKLNTQWNITKFNKCIPTQLKRIELEDNGRGYLQKVSALFDQALASLSLPKEYEITNLTPANAYLHIQGHKLYDLILNIGTLLCKGKRVAFKSDILDATFPLSGYPEINELRDDLSHILPG